MQIHYQLGHPLNEGCEQKRRMLHGQSDHDPTEWQKRIRQQQVNVWRSEKGEYQVG